MHNVYALTHTHTCTHIHMYMHATEYNTSEYYTVDIFRHEGLVRNSSLLDTWL